MRDGRDSFFKLELSIGEWNLPRINLGLEDHFHEFFSRIYSRVSQMVSLEFRVCDDFIKSAEFV